MADENARTATASETSTAQPGQAQPPAQPSNPASTTQDKTPALDMEKELQRIKSQMGREAAAARRAAEEAQARAAAAERQIREQRLSGMDELERAKYERDEAFQNAGYLQQQIQQQAQNAQRERDVAELMADYGAPRETFDDATDYADAVRKARAYEKAQREAQIEERVQKRLAKAEANAPDLGGGKPHDHDSFNAKLKEAKGKVSSFELAKLYVQETRRGK